MNDRTADTKAWLQIHLCVVLWGFTAILGKLISLPALPLVFLRMAFVSGVLLCTPRVWRLLRRLPMRRSAVYAGIGVVVALHWLTFYGSIKLANASVAVACLGLLPMFTALVEPLLAQRRWRRAELGLGLLAAPGVALVVGATPHGMRAGIAVGVASALLAAVFGSLNKRYVGGEDALAVTGLELGAGALALAMLGTLVGASVFVWPGARDLALLVVLALACTLLPFSLWLIALRRLSAFATALAVNLEPVYAILLAIVLLGEQRELGPAFYAGVAIILVAVFLHPLVLRARSA